MPLLVIYGELANVGQGSRLSIPMGVLQLVSWWKKQPKEVAAELVEEGLIRVYSAEEAEPLINELQASAEAMTPDAAFDYLSAVKDRYRSLKLYADGRLGLTKDVAQLLGFRPTLDKPTLYVQAFGRGIEVMSLSYRLRRLERTKESAVIGLHLQDISGTK